MSPTRYTRPLLTHDEVQQILLEHFDLTGSIAEMPGHIDQNFSVRADNGSAYILKIANANESAEELELQNAIMVHLAENHRAETYPLVIPTKDSQHLISIVSQVGTRHLVRLLSFVSGKPLSEVVPHSPDLLVQLGVFLGEMAATLTGFSHPTTSHDIRWNVLNSPQVLREYNQYLEQPEQLALVQHFLTQFESEIMPVVHELRTGFTHNDTNDQHILIDIADDGTSRIAGLIDFGDMTTGPTIMDLAIALTYVMMNKADPLQFAIQIIRGYHKQHPITELECRLLYYLIAIRLCLSVSISAFQKMLEPDNPHMNPHENAAWELLEKLREIPPNYAYYKFRFACGVAPCPETPAIENWLRENADSFGSIIDANLRKDPLVVFDLSVGSLDLGSTIDWHDVDNLREILMRQMKEVNARIGIGRYDEARLIYTDDMFLADGEELPERRTVHIGLDVFMEAGSPIYAPLDGVIYSFANNAGSQDYGPAIILEHVVDNGQLRFFTLYGHLAEESLDDLSIGKPIQQGEQMGWIGNYPSNGNWPPHLHFQIITDMLGETNTFPGVALASQRAVWLSLSPDPNLILRIPKDAFPEQPPPSSEIQQIRNQHLGESLSLSYIKSLNIVRGYRQYLYDENGQAYLDAVNNVPIVGHSHPQVVRAGQRQMSVLNTNTRYLHEAIARYAERLCAMFPDPLSVCFFVNSGSEANELALRLAYTHTQRRDHVVIDHAYHGHTTSLIAISPYKFDGPGGTGAPDHVHKVPTPDTYRGQYKRPDPQAGRKYAEHVQQAIQQLQEQDRGLAAFIAEPLMGTAGQIPLPDAYLAHVFEYVREAAGVCIADEVQIGFGRVGSHFWGFELQNVVPDIVTLGKPMGNGHPLAAVVTTQAIADSFNNGMEYFNTFGGNPVSCAIGMAVLDVIEQENLQQNALEVGSYLIAHLEELQAKHAIIGDVRGHGLFIGVELVRDHTTLEPADMEAAYIIERMKDHGILLSTDGPYHNVLKIKPPIIFTKENANRLASTLDKILREDVVHIRIHSKNDYNKRYIEAK